MGACDIEGCSGDESLPFTCNECGGTFCSEHRLPEAHRCEELRIGDINDLDGKRFEGGHREEQRDTVAEPDSLDEREQWQHWDKDEREMSPPESKHAAQDGSEEGHDEKGSSAIAGVRATGERLVRAAVATGRRAGRTILFPLRYKKSIAVLVVAVVLLASIGPLSGAIDLPTNGDERLGEQLDSAASGAVAAANNTSFQPPGDDELNRTAIENAVHRAVNEERRERGLQPLRFDTQLREIARYHSEDMASKRYFAHESPSGETMADRYEKFNYDCRVAISDNEYATGAENIAYTYADNRIQTENGVVDYDGNETAIGQGIVTQWMNSPGHRENILKAYWQKEGIGVNITETEDGVRVYATQNFC